MKIIQRQCFRCNSDVPKDIFGLNKKLLNRRMEKFFCLTCLADYLEVTPNELLDKVEEFKQQGCSLFS